MPVRLRDIFRLTPVIWWPVLLVSLVCLRRDIARARAAGYSHGTVWLLQCGQLWLELVAPLPPAPALPDWLARIARAQVPLAAARAGAAAMHRPPAISGDAEIPSPGNRLAAARPEPAAWRTIPHADTS